MAKIAVLFNSNLENPRGVSNAVINKVKHLKKVCSDFEVDVYAFASYDDWFTRILRNTKRAERVESKIIDGVKIHLIWSRFSVFNHLLSTKFHIKPFENKRFEENITNLLKDYELISVHSTSCGKIALKLKKKFNIPYAETWHGSDIHTHPFSQKRILNDTDELLRNAAMNFFVSDALYKTARTFSCFDYGTVVYNGVGDSFYKYDLSQKQQLRTELGISSKKCVAFVGNIESIKNARLLPDIFKRVYDNYGNNIVFFVIGDGHLRADIEKKTKDLSLPVKFWGNQPASKMPAFMNCIDILVLPSKNEGLPLVTVEALSCGANVVGSKVGGIPEVIGEENTFVLDENFKNNISDRILYMLNNKVEQNADCRFSWDASALIEASTYYKILNGK